METERGPDRKTANQSAENCLPYNKTEYLYWSRLFINVTGYSFLEPGNYKREMCLHGRKPNAARLWK